MENALYNRLNLYFQSFAGKLVFFKLKMKKPLWKIVFLRLENGKCLFLRPENGNSTPYIVPPLYYFSSFKHDVPQAGRKSPESLCGK